MLQCSLCVLRQVDELSTQHRHHLAENAALAECQTLMQEAASGWQATTRAAKAAAQAALMQAGQEYMHAATRHLYYQRALLQLLLRQLTFCVGELQGVLTCLLSWSSGLPDCIPCHDKTHVLLTCHTVAPMSLVLCSTMASDTSKSVHFLQRMCSYISAYCVSSRCISSLDR
jgi:hypothetical protein